MDNASDSASAAPAAAAAQRLESSSTSLPAEKAAATHGGGQNDKTTPESRGGREEGRGRDKTDFQRGRRGRGDSRGGRQGKKGDMGRNKWSKQQGDKRARYDRSKDDDESGQKRQRLANEDERGLPVYATKFSEAELKDEERRPKKKVAVMIGYSGTGYRGMQMTHDQKTIEGDLFKAFVAAGAISKANADDPKKSSFVRCARTDKGVHAAGNVISLKLIVEDEGIVQKINDNLTTQIRVWGYERTSNSFSAYQMVDSRIYEYLIPTHSFLPPHPRSFLGRKCNEWAQKKGEVEAWEQRQREVDGFWERLDEETITPILDKYDEDVRNILEKALWLRAGEEAAGQDEGDINVQTKQSEANEVREQPTETATDKMTLEERKARSALISEGIKSLRKAYLTAKRAYRIDATRLQRVREALETYVGTRNYHNYTVDKTFNDASAKRVIKSFVVHGDPIIINGTEWLSLKVHGQSFMMHQIRKMVGMAALVVRCGCDPKRIVESYGKEKISIPKAPSLGLLLERPIFDTYNKKASGELGKNHIDFVKYEKEMDEFKQREIYDRMHADEEKENFFGSFFTHIDNFPSETFLFVTSGGIEATTISDIEASDPAQKTRIELSGAQVDKEHGDVDSDNDDIVKDDAGNEG